MPRPAPWNRASARTPVPDARGHVIPAAPGWEVATGPHNVPYVEGRLWLPVVAWEIVDGVALPLTVVGKASAYRGAALSFNHVVYHRDGYVESRDAYDDPEREAQRRFLEQRGGAASPLRGVRPSGEGPRR